MAPVAKRRTISLAGSTFSMGSACAAFLSFISPRSVERRRL
jgi:hypothetical protein